MVRLNGDKMTETELVEAVEAGSLFSAPRLVVIEGLLGRRPSREKQRLINFLKGLSFKDYPSRIILEWESKRLSVAAVKQFSGKAVLKEFKLTRSLFKLLDSLRPGNGKYMSRLLNEATATDPVEVVMLMLGRRIAQLLVAKSSDVDGFSGLADWQIRQLTAQAANWSEKQLLDSHRRLVEIDEAVKTGSSPADFATHLDILLLSL